MRNFISILLALFCLQASAQFPYLKKLNYPDQLPTQVVYDMLTDSKGYIWIGTDKGLYRFNGKSFVSVPFNNTALKSVSYLQEDPQGVIWCMNFYNQLYAYKNDTLRKFDVDYNVMKNVSTFNNVIVGSKEVWLHSFNNIFKIDKSTHKVLKIYNPPSTYDPIIASGIQGDNFYAVSNGGYMFQNNNRKPGWNNLEQRHNDIRLFKNKEGITGLGIGLDRTAPFEIKNDICTLLKPINLPLDTYIFQGAFVDKDENWLCTQNGAYMWNKATGEAKCYLPHERVSDVVKDYQGNYWISTLDNGIFICSSLYNSLLKIYNDPLLDNFNRLLALPNGEILAGNSQGLIAKVNLDSRRVMQYTLARFRETEFISYDSTDNVIISNRGSFKPDQKKPLELFDYSKGVNRDRFGNIIAAVFNAALVMNDHYGSNNRNPFLDCPLYKSINTRIISYDGYHSVLLLRSKRSNAVVSSRNKESFWIAYEDGLYEYFYGGKIKILKDGEGKAVVGKSLVQLMDGSLAVGTSTKGLMIFKNGIFIKSYDEKNGLSSGNIKKIVEQDRYIWVLTDEGLDRIDKTNDMITNYLEEYGLSNISINDFCIQKNKLLFATPAGILVRENSPRYADFTIRFPLLRAISNGVEINNHSVLPDKAHDISFYFEALHYISITALNYRYRIKGIDTIWRSTGNFNNQLSFYRLSPGNYLLEIQAVAGANYKSNVRSFSFTVSRPGWQNPWVLTVFFMGILLIGWASLRQWKKRLIRRQTIKEQLLKSQLVALRAQMNPHFLYNVLNTVQGLVYGNRKTEAGALLGNFSDLMRKILQSSDKQLLSLEDEIENLRLYLELEKARFDEGFTYKIEMDTIEDPSAIYIPSLLLQPFAENAVKHGLLHKKGIKILEIKFKKTKDAIIVTIDDNGIGRLRSIEINQRAKNKPAGFATIALNERMELFNRLYKRKITCEITDKMDEKQHPTGTSIRLIIPDYGNDPDAL